MHRPEPAAPSAPEASEVVQSLLDYVLRSGEVGVGDKLPTERKFAETLGVGRSLVREAMKSLRLLGLVDIRHGDGTYVASTTSDLLPKSIEWGLLLGEQQTLETLEARHQVEMSIVKLAAQRRTEASLGRLRSHLEAMERTTQDPVAFIEADMEFHSELADAAGNRVLAQILSSLQSLILVWLSRVVTTDVDIAQRTVSEHRLIFEAVKAADSEAAEAAMNAHLLDARDRVGTVLRTDSVAKTPPSENGEA